MTDRETPSPTGGADVRRTIDDLQRLAAAFIDHGCAEEDPLITSLRGLVADTGGMGLCHDIAEAFQRFGDRHGWIILTGYSEPNDPDLPYMTGAHRYCFAFADGAAWIVDFTARQFDEALAFPLIVVALHGAMSWATSRAEGAPRSVEELAAWLASEAAAVLGVAVAVRLDLIVQPGPQRIVVDHAVLSRNA